MTDLNAIESLFNAALQQPDPAVRAAALEQACRGDQALRRHVERLLHAHFQAADFLQVPAAVEITTAHETSAEPSTVIGPFKLLEKIGEGGMGEVWVAEQSEPIRRRVALKLIKAGAATREVIARFEAERQALALMDHPHIARVLDAGAVADGRPFFVMELVRGVSLTEFCDKNQLTTQARIELFLDVCSAVQHAHLKGIIHRDLKPSNILVTLHDGKPVAKVIDFGIAKAVGQQTLTEKTVYTRLAQMIGTPLYMSPEQAEMSGLDIDTRTDIYSLGVVLYELLTGTTPLDRTRLQAAGFDEMRRLIREEDPPRPSDRISTLGEAAMTVAGLRQSDPKRLHRACRGELDWVVMKTLEKDRTRRYETAGALGDDLRRYLADEPVQACPPSRWYRLGKVARRHRLALSMAGVVLASLLLIIVALAISTVRVWHAMGEKQRALDDVVAAEKDSKEQLRTALIDRARAGRFSRKVGQRLDSLAAIAEAARIRPDERLRDEAIAAMALPDIRMGSPLFPRFLVDRPGLEFSDVAAALSSGSKHQLLAIANSEGVRICRLATDEVVCHIRGPQIIGGYLYFSPDERHLIGLSEGRTLHVWRVADGEPVVRDRVTGCWGHSFSPDGRHLAVCESARVLRFDLTTGREVNRWGVSSAPQSLAYHPDGEQLAVGYQSAKSVSVYDAAKGRLVADLPVSETNSQHVVAWHPHGRRLAVGSTSTSIQIQVWDVPARRQVALLQGHVATITALSFHPDGELLASNGWDGTLLWHPGSGRQLLQAAPLGPDFSRDGRLLGAIVWRGFVRQVEVASCPEYRTLVSNEGINKGFPYGCAFSPDGRLLAVGMVEGGVRLYDPRHGRELPALPVNGSVVFFDRSGGRQRLFTCGSADLLRWPVTAVNEAQGCMRFGPPRLLCGLNHAAFSRGPDGRAVAVASRDGGENFPFDLDLGVARRVIPPHSQGHGHVFAVSADGRWAVSRGWHSDLVRVWDARSGQLRHELVMKGSHNHVFFSPDSRVLVISRGDEYEFRSVPDWRLIRSLPRDSHELPGPAAFTADGTLAALAIAPDVVHLIETATGRTVARLADPHGDRATALAFSDDGTRLAWASNFARAVHVWDLRLIRRQLKAMNLDWDWPEFPDEDRSRPIVSVEVDSGYLKYGRDYPDPNKAVVQLTLALVLRPRDPELYFHRGIAYEILRKVKEAVADYGKALELLPKDDSRRAQYLFHHATWSLELPDGLDAAVASMLELEKLDQSLLAWTEKPPMRFHQVSWLLLARPKEKQQLDKVLVLMRKAVDLDPYCPPYRRTLAIVHLRQGRWREALEVLGPNLEEQPPDAPDLYLAAIAHRRLNDGRRADECLREATAAKDAEKKSYRGPADELPRCRAEAEAFGLVPKK